MINLNTTILSKPRFIFDGEYDRVVQKGNVGTSYVYALQLYRRHTCVLRGRRNDNSSTVKVIRSQEVNLTGSAGAVILKHGNMREALLKTTLMVIGLLALRVNELQMDMIGTFN